MATYPAQPVTLTWKGLDGSKDLVRGVTPAARLEYLYACNLLVLGAATTPYAVTGLHGFFTSDGASAAQVFAPGTRALEGRFIRDGTDTSAEAADTNASSSMSGGGGGVYQIVVASPFESADDHGEPTGAVGQYTSNEYQATPTEATDRLFEVVPAAFPQLDTYFIKNAVGFSGRVFQALDIDTLALTPEGGFDDGFSSGFDV